MKERIQDFFGLTLLFALAAMIIVAVSLGNAHAKQPRAKFYDFKDQLVDGEVKRPVTLYTNSHNRVKFNRLLNLKKSFLSDLYQTAKEKVFK